MPSSCSQSSGSFSSIFSFDLSEQIINGDIALLFARLSLAHPVKV